MYSNWRIKELKDELRKRGASLRGKKADLVERLEFYDQNFNFGRPESADGEDPKMQLPLRETYRDINSNTVLPPLDKTMIRHYLCYTQKKIHTAVQLYETRHLLMARASVIGDNTFIKGYCRKTMKSLQYEVDILLNKNGNPEASHCECPAGSGTNALCKHVAVLLLGIENMVREKLLILQEVCTQKLQQFHVPKKPYTGTPVKAEKFQRRKRNSNFEPYPLKNIDQINYNIRFRNLILGFSNSRMPLKQLYEPANPYALVNDHIMYTMYHKKIHTAVQLYETRHLLMARASVIGDNTFIKGYCRKTMKSLQYEVDILLNKNGNPEASHCECPAGSGTNALCKHVAVLLLGIENMVREKLLILQEVCTQKLQQFHVPKKPYTGTPVKAEKFQRRKRNSNFEPYPLKNIDQINYNIRFRNLILGFSNSRMPLKQLYEPANPYALVNDHIMYTDVNPEHQFLNEMKLNKITKEEANIIQNDTIGQIECPDWHKRRQVRLTASNFYTICNLRPTTMAKYAREIINKKEFNSRAASHGLLNEKIALNKYTVEYDLLIEPCGIFISWERPYLAASPDGLLGTETIIEIKCPYASRYQTISPTSVPYLELVNGVLKLKKSSPYYFQVQGQLYCSGRSYCNMIIYTYKDLKVVYIEKDNYFISSMLSKLDCFYNNYFKSALFEKHIYYNYCESFIK